MFKARLLDLSTGVVWNTEACNQNSAEWWPGGLLTAVPGAGHPFIGLGRGLCAVPSVLKRGAVGGGRMQRCAIQERIRCCGQEQPPNVEHCHSWPALDTKTGFRAD